MAELLQQKDPELFQALALPVAETIVRVSDVACAVSRPPFKGCWFLLKLSSRGSFTYSFTRGFLITFLLLHGIRDRVPEPYEIQNWPLNSEPLETRNAAKILSQEPSPQGLLVAASWVWRRTATPGRSQAARPGWISGILGFEWLGCFWWGGRRPSTSAI